MVGGTICLQTFFEYCMPRFETAILMVWNGKTKDFTIKTLYDVWPVSDLSLNNKGFDYIGYESLGKSKSQSP